MITMALTHGPTIDSFGDEWTRFDQSGVDGEELRAIFDAYFRVFPWDLLPADAKGADIGCGTGRWASFVAPRVKTLLCIDASRPALGVAQQRLFEMKNASLVQGHVGALPLAEGSLDFAYSLGVLHHLPETELALADCVSILKRGAPLLLYLYYSFDNRPAWFRALWRMSDLARRIICSLPTRSKNLVCDILAITMYWPLSRLAGIAERLGFSVASFPLACYRDRGFYTMRTDSRDRFGTPLEKRFTAAEIESLMQRVGLTDVQISTTEPFWCAVGLKA